MPYLFGDARLHKEFEEILIKKYDEAHAALAREMIASGKASFGAEDLLPRISALVPSWFKPVFASMRPVDLDRFITAAAEAGYHYSMGNAGESGYKLNSIYSTMYHTLLESYPCHYVELAKVHKKKYMLLQDISYDRQRQLASSRSLERLAAKIRQDGEALKSVMQQVECIKGRIEQKAKEFETRIQAVERPSYGLSYLVRIKSWRQALQASTRKKLDQRRQLAAEQLLDLHQQESELLAKLEADDEAIKGKRKRLEESFERHRQFGANIEEMTGQLDALNRVIVNTKEWLPVIEDETDVRMYELADRVADDTLAAIIDRLIDGRAETVAMAASTAKSAVMQALLNVTATNVRRQSEPVLGAPEEKLEDGHEAAVAAARQQAVCELMAEIVEASSHKAAVVQHMTANLVSGAFAKAAELVEARPPSMRAYRAGRGRLSGTM